MKKASGIIAILLLVVLAFGVFAGCGLFGKETAKYRQFTAVTVGNQKISVGKVIDTFNNLYNQYGKSGYSADTLFQAAMSSLYTQYMKVDSYIGDSNGNSHAYADFCGKDGYIKYLTADQAEYAIKYVKYLVFTNFDSAVGQELAKKVTLKDAEKKDTSRDFKTFDDIDFATDKTYTDYLVRKLTVNDDMNEYYEKYYTVDEALTITVNEVLDDYKNEAATKAKLDEYVKRVDTTEDKDATITLEQLTAAQDKVVKKYVESIEKAYEITMAEFFKQQVNDVAANLIAQLYDIQAGRSLDGEGFADLSAKLTAAYKDAVAAKKASYKFDDTFVKDIEGLTDDSDIYTVPDQYKYIFVKNVLVPFNASQKAVLANIGSKLGSTSGQAYKDARLALATQIVADDFTSEKDEDGNYKTTYKDLFEVSGGKITLKAGSEIANAIAGAQATSEEIKTLMTRFNTDTAQHSTYYDYVVRINAPEDYTAKWVPEFVKAAEEAYGYDSATGNHNAAGSYALCVSDYGVHIVFYTADVTATTLDFSTLEKCLKADSREYAKFKTLYSSEKSELLSKAVTELQKTYFTYKDADGKVISEAKIRYSAIFKEFLKDQGLTYDTEKAITYTDEK
mgnify:FL=1